MKKRFNTALIGARLASILLLLASAGLACAEGDEGSRKGLATVHIEGASQTASYRIDGRELSFPYDRSADAPLVIRAGRHVIEVYEGEAVALREEIVLEPGEVRTLRVEGGAAE